MLLWNQTQELGDRDNSLEKEFKELFIEKSSSYNYLSTWANSGETRIFFIFNTF